MCYQGSGINGADGLGLRLKIPKGIKKKIKSLGRGIKKVVRSPVFKGAVIGAAGGFIYQKIRSRKKLAQLKLKAPRPGTVPLVITPTRAPPTPVPYIEPPRIPVGSAGFPLPTATGGPSSGGPSMRVRQIIAEKIMAAIPLSPEEMAIVMAGWLGEGMKAAAEAAYGSDAYVPGAGQPLAQVDIIGAKDNTMLYAGLGLAALLLLGKPKSQRRRRA